MNRIEEEVILLKAITDAIDAFVNKQVFKVYGDSPDTNILFHDRVHQKFFYILLTDFLSRIDKRAPVKPTSYLSALREIVERPQFNAGRSVGLLRRTTKAFSRWLEKKAVANVWMPSIDAQVKLRIERITFIKMCGDLTKHNFLRAIGVAEDLQRALADAGVTVTREEALLAFEDFYAWFHDDILNYHGSTIAEFLNEIRWGVHEYLQHEFRNSIVWESREPPRYRYTYPTDVNSEFARACYWKLMNDVRRPPSVSRFKVTRYLKLRY